MYFISSKGKVNCECETIKITIEKNVFTKSIATVTIRWSQ